MSRTSIGGVAWEGGVLVEPAGAPDVVLPDGWTVAPGFVDLQVNGLGSLFPLERPDDLDALDEALARAGVTTWLCAVPSADPADVAALARAAADRIADPRTGLAGLHLEGPVLSPSHPGAHPPEHLRAGDDPSARTLLDLPRVRLVTLAPEVPGAMAYAADAAARGIVTAAGHTGATHAEGVAAIEAGVRLATHLFNAMTPVHQREPGAAVAYLLHPAARPGFIADGAHLHTAIEDLVLAAARDRAFLVSDAAPTAGVGRTAPEGVLAGSATTIADAVARLSARVGSAEAARLASDAPARALGLADRGRLEPGLRADLVVLDADTRVVGCVRSGEWAWRARALAAIT